MNGENKFPGLPCAFRREAPEPMSYVYDMPKEKRTILGEDAQQELNNKLRLLVPGDAVKAEYYLHRRYVIYAGVYERVDTVRRRLFLSGRGIPLDDLRNVFREDWL